MALTVGTLRTKWKRPDLHGKRGKSAKWKQCTLTLKLSPWGKSWKGQLLVNCCQGKKVPKAARMLTPFSLLCLFSPCSVKELFQLFWLQFVWFRRSGGIKGIQGITVHIIFESFNILEHTQILIHFYHRSCLEINVSTKISHASLKYPSFLAELLEQWGWFVHWLSISKSCLFFFKCVIFYPVMDFKIFHTFTTDTGLGQCVLF